MIVGIDLGTTNSLVAAWDRGAPRLLPNAMGDVLTPSCVSVDEDGSILVGRAARDRVQSHPDRTASVFKRYMGTDRVTRIGGRDFRPEELSSLVLRSLKEDAEAALGREVTEAIITVPAYFSDAQRKATRAAAQLAGLKAERLLNEPTAAALAYGIHQREGESKFLVFDLGGGTFDVSILDLFEGVMEVRATSGDNYLGGEDFVAAMVDHFFAEGMLPRSQAKDPELRLKASARCESLKRALSEAPAASAKVLHGGKEFTLELDEATFERLAEPLLQRLRDPVERALRDARMRVDDLDAVVLAGGASRMPMIQKLAANLFGRAPAAGVDPDKVVAIGAAVQAGLKQKDAALNETVMTDVAPYSLGVEVSRDIGGTRMNGHFDPVIERNTAIPVSRSKVYFPVNDRQRELDLKIFQGEARLVQDNIQLGRIKIPLPAAPKEECGVETRFTYDINGLLEVEAKLLRTGQVRRIVIQDNPGLLTEAEIAARFEALAALKIHPRDRMENRAALARGERIYGLLNGADRERFGLEMALFDRALASQEDREIIPARRRIEEVMDFVENEFIFKAGTVQ